MAIPTAVRVIAEHRKGIPDLLLPLMSFFVRAGFPVCASSIESSDGSVKQAMKFARFRCSPLAI